MDKQTPATGSDMGTLAEDARALMAATADVAGEKVGEARKRLAAALDSAREIAGRVRDKAVEGAKAATAVHEHPYQAIGRHLRRRCDRHYLISAGAPAMAIDTVMEPAPLGVGQLVERSKRFVRRLFTIVENRLGVDGGGAGGARAPPARHPLGLGMVAFGLLAGITLTAAIVVLLWPHSHVAVLLTLTGLYGVAAVWLYRRLTALLRDWQNLPATLDQLKKDRACLEKNLT
jgi:ElaB/YqjD/DUF883 family membrane-anchored ribosome-binding protein